MRLDRIFASVPVNRMAASVTGRGDGYDVTVKPSDHEHWSAPPVCEPRPSNAPDLAGTRFGRLRVVSWHSSSKKGGRWLCRCACGDYEIRLSRSVRNIENGGDCCTRCRRLEIVKKMGRGDFERVCAAENASNIAACAAGKGNA